MWENLIQCHSILGDNIILGQAEAHAWSINNAKMFFELLFYNIQNSSLQQFLPCEVLDFP